MKKYINKLLMVALFIGGLIGCDEGVPDEIFDKQILFTKNGHKEFVINYTESGNVVVPMSISINGTSRNDQNITVDFDLNTDTLRDFNFEKFRNTEILYYKILPEECYSLQKNVVIPVGEEYGLFEVALDLDKLDKFTDYLLPLTINKVSAYQIAPAPYSTSLIQFVLKNSFSGNYRVSGKVYEDGGDMDVTSCIFRVYDNTSCFFYAGHIDETAEDRDLYRLIAKIDPQTLELSLTSLNPALDLDVRHTAVEIDRRVDATNQLQEIVTTTIELNYYFNGLSNPSDPDRYRFEGTMTMVQYVDVENID